MMVSLALSMACATRGDEPRSEREPRLAVTEVEERADSERPSGPFFEPDDEGRSTPILRPDAKNLRYAALEPEACLRELDHREIATEAVAVPGVTTALWLRSPLHGVTLRSLLPPKQRLHSAVEIFDCRLLLALDDFAAILAAHDVVELVMMSAYRPKSSHGCTKKYDNLQHCAALAVDVGAFRKRDGTVVDVLRDFHGKVGLSTCTDAAKPSPPSERANDLWSWVCEAADRAIFHVVLTPNFNRAHKNHLHLEITPRADWMLIQ